MSGLKYGGIGGGINSAAYIGFVQGLKGEDGVGAYYKEIENNNFKERVEKLSTYAAAAGTSLVVLDENGGKIADEHNTKIGVTKDHIEAGGNRREVNLSLPAENPADLDYLDVYIDELIALKSSVGGAKSAREFLFGVMLLTHCL